MPYTLHTGIPAIVGPWTYCGPIRRPHSRNVRWRRDNKIMFNIGCGAAEVGIERGWGGGKERDSLMLMGHGHPH